MALGSDDRFGWHSAARIIAPDGAEHARHAAASAVISERPACHALATALASAAAGLAFRIGESGAAPIPAARPTFETLTSGSSGAPRRIRRSHASWIASFAVNARLFGIGPGTRVAVAGSLVQSLALYGALEALHLGAELHLLDGLRPDRQIVRLRADRIEVLYATPVQLRLMLDLPAKPVATLRLVVIGGSKLDPPTRTAARTLFPNAEIREFYGAAETSFITLSDSETPEGSVGRPYPGVGIDLRGPTGLQQIWVRSPYLSDGYADNSGAAQWQDGWLSVGEIGWLEDGYLYLSGRAGRMVTVADQNVFPEEIEAFLLTQPGVTRAAVIPRPDPLRGHVIEAVVEGGEAGTVLAACRARLGPLKTPRRLHRVPDWPLLPSGKTDLAALARTLP